MTRISIFSQVPRRKFVGSKGKDHFLAHGADGNLNYAYGATVVRRFSLIRRAFDSLFRPLEASVPAFVDACSFCRWGSCSPLDAAAAPVLLAWVLVVEGGYTAWSRRSP